MAGELIWSRAALDDLEAIAAFIARDSRIHARRCVERLLESCERLLAQPSPSPIRAEIAHEGPREHQLPGFRILYEKQGEDLHLLAVLQDRRTGLF